MSKWLVLSAFLVAVPALSGCGGSGGAASAKLKVDRTSGLVTTEAGGHDQIKISLTSAPDKPVTLRVWVDDPNEGKLDRDVVTFQPSAYRDLPVVVTGVDDPVRDGHRLYHIVLDDTVSDDPAFVGLHASPVAVTNEDDESPAILVGEAAPGQLDEKGGVVALPVRLTSRPSDKVVIPVEQPEDPRLTVSPTTLVFYPRDWDQPRMLTVRSHDDTVAQGPLGVRIPLGSADSSDVDYLGLDAPDGNVLVADDDHAGVVPSAASVSLAENGTATFTVQLATPPREDVTVPVESVDPQRITVSPATLLFTAADWNVAHTVTVSGVDNRVIEAMVMTKVRFGKPTSADPIYAAVAPSEVAVVVTDNDVAALVLVPPTVLETSERDAHAVPCKTFKVSLGARPTGTVDVSITSSVPSEALPTPASVHFDAGNFESGELIQLCGQDDTIHDGDRTYDVTVAVTASSDPAYQQVGSERMYLINRDDGELAGDWCSTAIPLTPGAPQATYNTAAFGNDLESPNLPNTCRVGSVGRDLVFSVTIPAGKLLSVSAQPASTWDLVLASFGDCAQAAASCLGYKDGPGNGGVETLEYRNSGSTDRTVFVSVDGFLAQDAGSFTISATLLP